MKNLIFKYKHLLAILLIVIPTILVYWRLPNSYFEQDEWHSFGYYLYLWSLTPGKFIESVLGSSVFSHFTPFSLLTKMTMFKFFGLSAVYYFYISIFLHLLVSVLVYVLIFTLTSVFWSSVLGALFFALNASGHQAVTWLGTFEGVEGSAIFGLLASIIYLKNKNKVFVISLFILLSLLFKENGLVFLLTIIGLEIFTTKRSLRLRLNYLSQLMVGPLIYLGFKFSYVLTGVRVTDAAASSNQVSFVGTLIYNGLTLVPKFLSSITFPQEFLTGFAQYLALFIPEIIPGKNQIWLALSDYTFDFIALSLGLMLLAIFIRVLKGRKKELVLVGGYLLTSIILILPLKRFFVYPDSRYFYTATIGVAVFYALFLRRWRGGFIFVCLILINAYSLKLKVADLVKDGTLRRGIISQVNDILPELKPKSLIYASSSKSFYGLTERILPFQSGFGEVLLVNYALKQKIPAEFFTNDFLWNIKDQGYKEYGNVGFGFFYSQDLLEKAKLLGGVPLGSIFGFSYTYPDLKITDITAQVRNVVVGEETVKTEVPLGMNSVTAAYDSQDINLVVDRNLKTFWSSKIHLSSPQFLEIRLDHPRQISQVQIDSSGNPDRSDVGYSVLLSGNGQNWEEVFRDERMTPDSSGIVNIYLLPKSARFVKIQQIGYPGAANWIVNELKLYEAIH